MAIVELTAPIARYLVAWFQAEPPDEAKEAFQARGFTVGSCTAEELHTPAYLRQVAGVVFTQQPTKLPRIVQELKQNASLPLDFDCRVIVRLAPGPANTSGNAGRAVLTTLSPSLGLPIAELGDPNGEPPFPHLHVFDTGVAWNEVANYVLQHPSERLPVSDTLPSITTITHSGASLNLTSSQARLVRRAFFDCSEVHLVAHDDGRSGVMVCRAHATLRTSHLGPWPVPYFVKLGARAKILTEYQNYHRYVEPYIPFHLGPHLVQARCHLGATEGIIVGEYVDESESLLACAQAGRAAAAISCLFDRTLHGWHRIAQPAQRALLAELPWPRRVNNERIARARELGATRTLDELHSLFAALDSQPVLYGPIHGDLHASNVRVRGADAIAIDFFAHGEGPLLRDAAALEASLLVDGLTNTARKIDVRALLSSTLVLYEQPQLTDPLPACDPKDVVYWFHSCVRQIRLYARRMEYREHQYAAALAAALLMKAGKDSNAIEPEASVRALAYVLAESVLASALAAVQTQAPP